MTVLLDFEARSRANLKKVGGRNYARHASTEALCAVLCDTETGQVGLWLPGDPPPVTADDELAAHNAVGFDQFMGERFGWPKPKRAWVDTSEAARRAGLPGALDALGTRWLGLPKDKVASKYTKSLSKFDDIADACPPLTGEFADKKERNRARTRQRKDFRALPRDARLAEVRRTVVGYCASDVEIMAHGWPMLKPFVDEGVFGGWEADVCTVSRIVNDRGILFDADLAARLLACDETNQGRAIDAAAKACGWTAEFTADVVAAPAQLAAWIGAPDATASTIDDALANDPDPAVQALCRARQAVAAIAAGKLRAGLASRGPDDRLRDMLRYYGAHTGRYAGKVLQPHNFPRPTREYEGWGNDEIAAHADLAGGSAIDVPPDMLDVLLRATLMASPGYTLAVCDFAGVEARALAWCAGDTKALAVFRAYDAGTGPDPYIVAAADGVFGMRGRYAEITKVQRSAGKIAELALGYQGGVNALLKMARQNGVDLAAAGVNPQAVVDGWRKLHEPIVRFWKALHTAFVNAVRGESSWVDRFEFVPCSGGTGNAVAIFLPSGRPIIYNGVGLSRGKYGPEPYYLGQKGREHIYGGKIAENVIQAMCRDFMTDALIRAEEDGLCPVLHVHDEIVCEVPEQAGAEALAHLKRIMTTMPEWGAGFPVGAAGHHGKRYRK